MSIPDHGSEFRDLSALETGPETGLANGPANGPALPRAKSEVSVLALVAFIASILVCISPIGVILGMIALVRLVGQPTVRGRGLAIGAIVLGLFFSIGAGRGLSVLLRSASELEEFAKHEPGNALAAGFAGDIGRFRGAFSSEETPEEAAHRFVDALRERYGEFRSMELSGKPARPRTVDEMERAVVPGHYRAEFDAGQVDFEVELLLAKRRGDPTQKLESMRVLDRTRDNLRYPPLPPPPTGRREPESGAPP